MHGFSRNNEMKFAALKLSKLSTLDLRKKGLFLFSPWNTSCLARKLYRKGKYFAQVTMEFNDTPITYLPRWKTNLKIHSSISLVSLIINRTQIDDQVLTMLMQLNKSKRSLLFSHWSYRISKDLNINKQLLGAKVRTISIETNFQWNAVKSLEFLQPLSKSVDFRNSLKEITIDVISGYGEENCIMKGKIAEFYHNVVTRYLKTLKLSHVEFDIYIK